jgi:D-3-phosphoglycerate dehydrogenase
MKIAILDDHQDAVRSLECFSLLDGHEVRVFNEPFGSADALAEFDALVLIRERTAVTAELLAQLPRLRQISQTGRVGRNIDVQACTARGIAVSGGVGSPIAPAELTWALILAAARRVPQYAERLKHSDWQQSGTGLGYALHGRTLGIYGYGKIGSRVAGYGRAFGMSVLAWGRAQSRAAAKSAGDAFAESAAGLFARSDVLTLHLRLDEETAGIVGADDFARMKSSALFVNTARAELVEPGALLRALERGRPSAAAVDVFETEPLRDHALLALDNVVATPHLGYVERDSYELYLRAAFENVLAFAAGHYDNVVNLPGP